MVTSSPALGASGADQGFTADGADIEGTLGGRGARLSVAGPPELAREHLSDVEVAGVNPDAPSTTSTRPSPSRGPPLLVTSEMSAWF